MTKIPQSKQAQNRAAAAIVGPVYLPGVILAIRARHTAIRNVRRLAIR